MRKLRVLDGKKDKQNTGRRRGAASPFSSSSQSLRGGGGGGGGGRRWIRTVGLAQVALILWRLVISDRPITALGL